MHRSGSVALALAGCAVLLSACAAPAGPAGPATSPSGCRYAGVATQSATPHVLTSAPGPVPLCALRGEALRAERSWLSEQRREPSPADCASELAAARRRNRGKHGIVTVVCYGSAPPPSEWLPPRPPETPAPSAAR